MELLTESPFMQGLIVGAVIVIILWVKGSMSRRALFKSIKNENRELKTSLNAMMKARVEGDLKLSKEKEELEEQLNNLRTTVATLSAKPGVVDIRELEILDRAIRLMYEQAPGFAPVWENARKTAELEVKKYGRGTLAWIRKKCRPLHRIVHTTTVPATQIQDKLK